MPKRSETSLKSALVSKDALMAQHMFDMLQKLQTTAFIQTIGGTAFFLGAKQG
jgi:hypothetical protein